MRVQILHDDVPADARPDELDTLVQVAAVERALLARGNEVARAAFTGDLAGVASAIATFAPDVVFNLVESVLGRGRLIHVAPALFEALQVPFAGAGSVAMATSSSKQLAKGVLERAQLATPAWHTAATLASTESLPRCSWIVKSVHEHGSLGLEPGSVVVAPTRDELEQILSERAEALGGECFAEEYIHGREFNVAVLDGPDGPEVLPIPEILFLGVPDGAPRVVGYRAKWADGSAESVGTPRRFLDWSDPLYPALAQLGLATFRAFELAGWARIDVRTDQAGRAFVVDVNANPCLSPDAGFAATLDRAGIGFEDAVARVVGCALVPRPVIGAQRVQDSQDRR